MAERRSRIVLSVPWDDETEDHPAGWKWEALVYWPNPGPDRPFIVVDFEDVDENGNPAAS